MLITILIIITTTIIIIITIVIIIIYRVSVRRAVVCLIGRKNSSALGGSLSRDSVSIKIPVLV